MSFANLSDHELETEAKKSVLEETKMQIKILHLLAEIERRRLYSKTQSSLFDYCVKVLKLSCGSAQRRIDTMRAMKIMPEIEAKLLSGELNLSTVSKAQSFFRQEKKLGKNYSSSEKKRILKRLENKSSKECWQELVAISPQAIPQERRRSLTQQKTELKIVVDQELLDKLDQLKALWSHRNPNMSDAELLTAMADLCLKKIDPMRTPPRKQLQKRSFSLPLVEVGRRALSVKLKRDVWRRDQGKCSFPGCESKYFLEYDHIRPVSFGGESTLENLRLMCRVHNQRAAIEQLGFEKMNQYINKS